jgi:hypothetical protein
MENNPNKKLLNLVEVANQISSGQFLTEGKKYSSSLMDRGDNLVTSDILEAFNIKEVPLTPDAEKKLIKAWKDWGDILTIKGQAKEMQQMAKHNLAPYLVGWYVIVTKKDLSSQKAYEGKISNKKEFKIINTAGSHIGEDSRVVPLLKKQGVESIKIVSIPNSNIRVPIFKLYNGDMATPVGNSPRNFFSMQTSGIFNIDRIAKLAPKKVLLKVIEDTIHSRVDGMKEKKQNKTWENFYNRFTENNYKNWMKILWRQDYVLGNYGYPLHYKSLPKVIMKELQNIPVKEISDMLDKSMKHFSKEVPKGTKNKTVDLEKLKKTKVDFPKEYWYYLLNIITDGINDELEIFTPVEMGLGVTEDEFRKVYKLKELPTNKKEKEILKKVISGYINYTGHKFNKEITDNMSGYFGIKISPRQVLTIVSQI